MYDFPKEMYFREKPRSNKSPRDRSLIKSLKSPPIMASGFSTNFSQENPNELCDRIKLLLQEKQAGNNSDINKQKIVAIVEKLLEYQCISTKQHKILLLKCSN